MKVSDIYGPKGPGLSGKVKSSADSKDATASPQGSETYPARSTQSLIADSMLCRRGVDIFLNHKWGPGWICRRCGAVADIKGLLK